MLLYCLHYFGNSFGEARPVSLLFGQPLATSPRQLVKLGATIVFREPPLSHDPTALLHPVKSRIERAFFDLKRIVGDLLNPPHNIVAVQWAQRKVFKMSLPRTLERSVRVSVTKDSSPNMSRGDVHPLA